MARRPKPPARDQAKLTGKPLRQTLIPSPIYQHDEPKDEAEPDSCSTTTQNAENEYTKGWLTSPDLYEDNLPFSPEVMINLANFLLANPNQNASHLFRADILFDSSGELKTPLEKERMLALNHQIEHQDRIHMHDPAVDQRQQQQQQQQQQQVETKYPAAKIQGLTLQKTVVLTLIPRNLNLDRPMNQTCYFYEGTVASPTSAGKTVYRVLQIRFPHVDSAADMPFYHPLIRGFAYLYDFEAESSTEHARQGPGKGTLSLHILPFPAAEGFDPFPTRLERTLQALLATHIRLARSTQLSLPSPGSSNSQRPGKKTVDETYNPFLDNLIPRHLIQNTYTRLKLTYAHHLCEKWVENTEPSKHVFEDLSITAFLIELWRNMYGVIPKSETETNNNQDNADNFPGFVDVACGNGVLVYILLMEGYKGWGFDARRRKTWSIFPDWVQQNLHESLYIPKPFAVQASSQEEEKNNGSYIISDLESNSIAYHTGDFSRDTFIISNHADELTVWTPLMAALACPDAPLPFVSIPCCSHSLSGARYRYPPPKRPKDKKPARDDDNDHVNDRENQEEEKEEEEEEEQPATGDLKALRKTKLASSTSQPGADLESSGVLNSMYGSLTAKTMNIAAEVGYDVEKTLLRIPSTRNMGVVGGRRSTIQKRINPQSVKEGNPNIEELINEIVRRECAREGGVTVAANIWIQRAIGLQKGKKSGGH